MFDFLKALTRPEAEHVEHADNFTFMAIAAICRMQGITGNQLLEQMSNVEANMEFWSEHQIAQLEMLKTLRAESTTKN